MYANESAKRDVNSIKNRKRVHASKIMMSYAWKENVAAENVSKLAPVSTKRLVKAFYTKKDTGRYILFLTV